MLVRYSSLILKLWRIGNYITLTLSRCNGNEIKVALSRYNREYINLALSRFDRNQMKRVLCRYNREFIDLALSRVNGNRIKWASPTLPTIM